MFASLCKILLLLILIFPNANFIISQEEKDIYLIQNFQTLNPGKYFEIIEDPTGKLTFNEIINANLSWTKLKNENANFGFSTSYFWIRFTLINSSSTKINPILELGFPRQDLIEFYNFKNEKYELKTTGDNFPFNQREIEDANFTFALELPASSRQIYFIRTRSLFNISFLNPTLHQSLHSFYKEASLRILKNGILYGFLLIMAFYNLFIFFIVKERVYLYLSGFILTAVYLLASGQGNNFQYLYPNNPWLANRDGYIFAPILLLFQTLFASSYLELKTNLPKIYRLLKYYNGFLLIFAVTNNLPMVINNSRFIFKTINFLVFFTAFLCIGLSITLIINNFRPAYFYLISWGIFSISLLIRALAAASLLPINSFTFYGFQFGLALMLILISIGLADKINYLKHSLLRTNQKLEDYSDHLEEKIIERTKELQSTLDTVNKLKIQQDGDYFLTTLLLEPFIVNKSKSKQVSIDFLLVQKKKFDFYSREHQIGGDLCHSQNLELNNKRYILIFNSDAMGKSLQGAGGAIVFGSVLISIIERTKANVYAKDISPERWLKNTFIELHKVFLTFECTMLVSTVIGLVEEESGLFYFINAEHPRIVSYANKKCSFIERENYFTKIGSPTGKNKVFVNLHPLKKNDVLYIGSDGRDDFLLKEENTEKILNQNDMEFLITVEEADGNLRKVHEIICEKGQIMDDLSLIRIQYLADNNDSSHLKKISLEKYKSGDLEEALSCGLEYISKNQADTEFFFFLGSVYFHENLPKKAVNFFERVRLRNPYNLENLSFLAETHFLLGNLFRAKKILGECLVIDPKNLNLSSLIEKLQIEIT